MKNIILFLAVFLGSGLLFAQDQTVKFYLEDESFKTYNIEDIENISLIKTQSDLEMKIFLQGSLSESYPLVNIDSMKFESVDDIIRNLVIYVAGSESQSHLLADIDSIIFSQTSAPAPFIESIEFSSAIIGEEVTISGSNFGDTQGESSITFTGAIATDYTSWDDSEINVIVPMGTQTGYVSVIVNNIISNGKYFKVIPQISEINPTSGEVGGIVTITGTGFGPEQATSRVYFGDVQAIEFTSWDDTEIQVKVPAEATSGKVYIRIKSLLSNEVDFTIVEVPEITSINPTSFSEGEAITINGTGFGSTQSTSIVTFNNTDAIDITSWSDNKIICKTPVGAKSGKLSVTVSGYMSNQVDFTIIDLDPNEVKIGSQIWTKTNLDASTYRNGNPIPQVTNPQQWVNLTTGAWCYQENNSNNGTTYGKLYNWYAVNDPRGLAPEGYHIPSDEEWKTLEMYLGMSQSQADTTGNRGTDQGGKLKEAGTAHWQSPNDGATNETGFTALPGGGRGYEDGSYLLFGRFGYWWTSSEYDDSVAWYRIMTDFHPKVSRLRLSKNLGFSVRLIKD
ncbi:FISUMP domain-containing protein [Bacteroidota bacterium]